MNSVDTLLVGIAAVCLPVMVPVLVFLGRQWVSLFLVPAVGAVLIGLAAVGTVLLELPLVTTWLGLGIVANIVTLGWWLRGGRTLGRIPVDGHHLVASVLGTLVATAWASNRALSWDVHSFWYSRGRWFVEGPQYVVQQLGSPYTSPYPGPPHATYPPWPSAGAGLMWDLAGEIDYFSAKLLLAGVTASTLVLLAVAVGRWVEGPRWLAWMAAFLVPSAALYFATSSSALGHMDLPYAVAGEAALLFGFLLPRRKPELCLSVVLCLLCGFTKNEGFVVAVLVALLVSLRHARRDPRRFLVLAVPWLGLLFSWRLAVYSLGGGASPPTGRTQADELAVLRPLPSPDVTTLVKLEVAHLWWLAVPLIVGLVMFFVLTRKDLPGGRALLGQPVYRTALSHAVVAVPLFGATGVALMDGPGLPWAELLLRTQRYFTFGRLAITVCLLVLAASALKAAQRPVDDASRVSGPG